MEKSSPTSVKRLHINNHASRMAYSGVKITSFPVRQLPVADLWQSVDIVPAFMGEIKKSLLNKGLINPIIVVRMPREDVTEYFATNRGTLNVKGLRDFSTLPYTPIANVVWGGTNRVEAVRELGFTHIDCVIIPDFETASRIQDTQRSSYKGIKNAASEEEGSV